MYGGYAKKDDAGATKNSGLFGGRRPVVPTPFSLGRERGCSVMADRAENHNIPMSGHLGSRKTRVEAGNPPRRKEVRAELRELYKFQAQPTTGSWKDADPGARRTIGNRVRRFRWHLAAVKTREFDAVGPGEQVPKMNRNQPDPKGNYETLFESGLWQYTGCPRC